MSEQLSIFERARQAAKPDDPFESWWTHYPRKKDKHDARKAFKTAMKAVDYSEILECVKAFSRRVADKDETFIPYAATWLNKRRWLDEKPNPEIVENREEKRLQAIAWIIKRGMHTTTVGPTQARECLRAGLITEKEAKDYGA